MLYVPGFYVHEERPVFCLYHLQVVYALNRAFSRSRVEIFIQKVHNAVQTFSAASCLDNQGSAILQYIHGGWRV